MGANRTPPTSPNCSPSERPALLPLPHSRLFAQIRGTNPSWCFVPCRATHEREQNPVAGTANQREWARIGPRRLPQTAPQVKDRLSFRLLIRVYSRKFAVQILRGALFPAVPLMRESRIQWREPRINANGRESDPADFPKLLPK